MGKTKKQHYVPRCYLERFQIPGKYQVHVYDKKKKECRINSIHDIASENYFYDIMPCKPSETSRLDSTEFPSQVIHFADNNQYIEHYLANVIEGDYAKLLDKIVNQADHINDWTAKNCFFLLPAQKMDFSICLAIQYLRTKVVRESIYGVSDCLLQCLKDMNAPRQLVDSVRITEEEAKDIHAKMIIDYDNVMEAAILFNRLNWILCINRSSKLFYSSDAPVSTIAHVKHPFLSMSGLSSPGVEVFFPISPSLILLMYDGEYHKSTIGKDLFYDIIRDKSIVNHYNSLTLLRSHRCVYSANNSLTLIEKIINDDPQGLETPSVELRWAGNVYHPRDK